jgi:hypothetical protein
MQWKQCPLCFTELEVRDVTPCATCGGSPGELVHLRDGHHTFHVFRVFGELELPLCNFCMVDFGSQDPGYFGLPPRTRIGLDRMQFVRDIAEPRIETDKFCPRCGHRLAFLRFVDAARQCHAGDGHHTGRGSR